MGPKPRMRLKVAELITTLELRWRSHLPFSHEQEVVSLELIQQTSFYQHPSCRYATVWYYGRSCWGRCWLYNQHACMYLFYGEGNSSDYRRHIYLPASSSQCWRHRDQLWRTHGYIKTKYNIITLKRHIHPSLVENVPFLHAIRGCDTTYIKTIWDSQDDSTAKCGEDY